MLLSNFLLTILAFVIFGLTSSVFNILVKRWLGPAFLGQVNQTLALFYLVPLFFAPGLGLISSKFASEFRGANVTRKSLQVFTFAFLVTVAIAVVCTGVVWVLFPILKSRLVIDPFTKAALAPMLLLYSLHIYLRASYFGFDRVWAYFRNEVISALIFFATLAIAVYLNSQRLAVLTFAAHSSLFALIAIADLRDRFDFRALFPGIVEDLGRYSRFFVATIVNSVAGSGAIPLGIILTGHLTGDAATVGYFSLLLNSLRPLSLLPTALGIVLVPLVSKPYGAGRTEEGIAVSTEAFRPLCIGLLFLWAMGLILGWEIVELIANESSVPLLIAFELILLGMCAYLVAMPPTVLLNATRHIGIVAWGGLIATVIAIGFWAGAIPAWGLVASAGGYCALQTIKSVWSILAARRIYGWRGGIGWRGLIAASSAALLGAVSLTNSSRPLHLILAAIFALLFFVLYGNLPRDYTHRVAALARSEKSVSNKVA